MSSVRDIVETIGKDHLGELLISIDEMFHGYGIEEHNAAIDLLLASTDELDSGEIIYMMHEFLKTQMLETLSEFKLTFVEEVEDLKMLKNVFEFMFEFDEQDAVESYLNIMDEGIAPDDILFDMLSLKYGNPSIEYGTLIAHVRPSLIDDLKERANERLTRDQTSEDVMVNEKARMFFLKEQPERFKRLVDDGFAFGFNVSTYLDEMFKDNDLDVRSKSLMDSYSKDIAMAILASKQTIAEASSLLEELLEPYLPTDMLFNEEVYTTVKLYINGANV